MKKIKIEPIDSLCFIVLLTTVTVIINLILWQLRVVNKRVDLLNERFERLSLRQDSCIDTLTKYIKPIPTEDEK